jgi:hypothetical protein
MASGALAGWRLWIGSDRCNSLHETGWIFKETFFKGDDVKFTERPQQFTRTQEKISSGGFSNGFVPLRKCFVNEYAVGLQTLNNGWEQGAP